jgi:hypothetical protein
MPHVVWLQQLEKLLHKGLLGRDGALDRARQTSSLRGDIALVIGYVLWFRKLDPRQPLRLTAGADRGSFALLSATTEEEITDFLQ